MTLEWRLARKYPRSKFHYVWNGYRYGSSGHWRADGSLGSIRRRAKRYLGYGGQRVVISIRSKEGNWRERDSATITYWRYARPEVVERTSSDSAQP